jgi:hypothetical protein
MRFFYAAPAAAVLWGSACGSTVTTETASSGGGASSSSTQAASTVAASSSSAVSSSSSTSTGAGGSTPACMPAAGPVLAVDQLLWGDTDWNGKPSSTAWKLYGTNIDGLVTTTQDMTGHCKLRAGAQKSVAADGESGLDNSFGRNLMPVFTSLTQDFSANVNKEIAAGKFTVLFELEKLVQNDMSPVVTDLYLGGALKLPPSWDGKDCWPIDPSSGNPATVFPKAAIAGNQWNSITAGDVTIPVTMGGARVELVIHQAKVTVVLSGDHKTGKLGIISGVLDREELIQMFKTVAGSFSKDLCNSTTFDSIAEQFRQASDIMKDGKQDPDKECDGISIGIGFTLRAAGKGDVVKPPPKLDPCK